LNHAFWRKSRMGTFEHFKTVVSPDPADPIKPLAQPPRAGLSTWAI